MAEKPEKDLMVCKLQDRDTGEEFRVPVYGTIHEHTHKYFGPFKKRVTHRYLTRKRKGSGRPPSNRPARGKYFKNRDFDRLEDPVPAQRLFVKVNNAGLGWTAPPPGPRHVVAKGDVEVTVTAQARTGHMCKEWKAWEQVQEGEEWKWKKKLPGADAGWTAVGVGTKKSTLTIEKTDNDWWVVACFEAAPDLSDVPAQTQTEK